MIESVKHLRRITSGYTASRVLLTATNYHIFDCLETQMTARGLAKRLSLDPRATEILLDALVSLDFLKKSGNKYKNTKTSSTLLVRGKPYYQGDILAHHDLLWDSWSNLDEVLRSGKPSPRTRHHDSFIKGMHNLSILRAEKIISSLDLEGVKKILDLGGGPGTYAIEFAKRGIHAVLFDIDETYSIAREIISQFKVKGTIDFMPGDFLVDDIGKGYDIVLISQIFHAYGEKENIGILRKVNRALNNKGRVVIQEFLVNDSRTAPPPGALFAVNMLVGTSGGRTYSPREMTAWLKKTGFTSVKKSLFEDNVVLEARKASR
jgi:ubiquinone/menaquinone biosynthesis C-methylase UbiE